MNKRERLNAIFSFETPDRLPVWQLETITEGAIRRWCLEGMPIDQTLADYLGLEAPERIPLDSGPIPSFVVRTVAEDEASKTSIDVHGFTIRTLKRQGVRPWLSYHDVRGPIATREDWERYKKRLDPHDIRRYPKSWGPELFDHYRTTSNPVCLYLNWGPGRGVKNGYMLGFEEFLVAVHDDPGFIQDIFDFWADFSIELLRPVLEAVPLDFFLIHEDGLGYRNSTIISPAIYRALWLPYVRRVVDFVRAHGVRVIGHKSSGNICPLIPAFLEAGINMFSPLECAAGVDAIELRKEYGRDVLLVGNIAREALMGDREAIEKEFYRKVPRLVEQGGYLPMPDDAMMPDWPLDTVRHYVELVRNFVVG